ncbi:helix-turn-helix domain-containing protein [Thiohalocapsa sp.]|uniref:helix-turn-helix domain-containing protein n=1 Tax=Thiohalocapsa sp. TaxID=2497641 RepID=UPI0025DA517D|nr:helix-turn-helix transcriptional regulator [Thiohalocapsa sp.]
MSESPAGRLRAARTTLGLSLSQLADLTGGTYSKSRIGNYEQGIRRMAPAAAQALAKALGNVSAQYLLFGDDAKEMLTAEERRLLDAYRNSDAAGRRWLIECAERAVWSPKA